LSHYTEGTLRFPVSLNNFYRPNIERGAELRKTTLGGIAIAIERHFVAELLELASKADHLPWPSGVLH
jgi:hypothetical protein